MLLKAAPAEHGPSLRGLEWHSGFGSALGAGGASLRTHLLVTAQSFCLALFAALRVVFELLIVEKDLLACSEYKICATVNAC